MGWSAPVNEATAWPPEDASKICAPFVPGNVPLSAHADPVGAVDEAAGLGSSARAVATGGAGAKAAARMAAGTAHARATKALVVVIALPPVLRAAAVASM
jgi:hypothetical protein